MIRKWAFRITPSNPCAALLLCLPPEQDVLYSSGSSSRISASDRLWLCPVDHSGRVGRHGPRRAEGDRHQCVRSPPQAYQRHRETAGRSARSEH